MKYSIRLIGLNNIRILFFLPLFLYLISIAGCEKFRLLSNVSPIRIGILHSQTGTMAISENPVIDATLFAVEKLNNQNGVLGRKVVPVIADGASDWPTFAHQAERLIVDEKVSVVFGCWTSASRKTVKPIIEKYNHLLFYPVQYEGLEESKNIVYTGAAPNQQIIPATKWCFDNLGKRIFLVGSDYVFPRTANEIIKDQVRALKGEIVGERYLLLGSRNVSGIISEIKQKHPDVILNTINGDSNLAFFTALRDANIWPGDIPTMSFSIAENELRALGADKLSGDYACWNYFQCIKNESNKKFVREFKEKFGADRTLSDPMEAAYFGVLLWAQAVEEVGTENVNEVRKTLANQSFNAPEGMVYINSENRHTWKSVRIGKIHTDGQFEILWSSNNPIRPVPFPISRTRSEWNDFLDKLYNSWGQKWANPGN